MIRLDVMHSSTTLGHMTSPSHSHHNRLTSSFSSSCCLHFSQKSKQALIIDFITKMFCEHQKYANFSSVDHFATIKSQKSKLALVQYIKKTGTRSLPECRSQMVKLPADRFGSFEGFSPAKYSKISDGDKHTVRVSTPWRHDPVQRLWETRHGSAEVQERQAAFKLNVRFLFYCSTVCSRVQGNVYLITSISVATVREFFSSLKVSSRQ